MLTITQWENIAPELHGLLASVEHYTLEPDETRLLETGQQVIQWYLDQWPVCACGSTVMPGLHMCSACAAAKHLVTFQCPKPTCRRLSLNPQVDAVGYCAHCHEFADGLM